MGDYAKLKFRKNKHLIALVETPKHSCNKFALEQETGFFQLSAAMPTGFSFPYDFGLIPQTKGQDGDPLDVLILCEHPTFPGCVVECRLLGSLHVMQRETNGKLVRNDRFIAVAAESKVYSAIHTIKDISAVLLREIEHFFWAYANIQGKKLQKLHYVSQQKSWKAIEESVI